MRARPSIEALCGHFRNSAQKQRLTCSLSGLLPQQCYCSVVIFDHCLGSFAGLAKCENILPVYLRCGPGWRILHCLTPRGCRKQWKWSAAAERGVWHLGCHKTLCKGSAHHEMREASGPLKRRKSEFYAGVLDVLDTQSFDELVLFLMVYRRREGFCREEVGQRPNPACNGTGSPTTTLPNLQCVPPASQTTRSQTFFPAFSPQDARGQSEKKQVKQTSRHPAILSAGTC